MSEPVALLLVSASGLLARAVEGSSVERAGILVGRGLSRRHTLVTGVLEAPRAPASPVSVVRPTAQVHEQYSAWRRRHPDDDYVGEWHTHPPGYLSPSEIDLDTMRQIARQPTLRALPILMLICAATPSGPVAIGRHWTGGAMAPSSLLMQRADEGPRRRTRSMRLGGK